MDVTWLVTHFETSALKLTALLNMCLRLYIHAHMHGRLLLVGPGCTSPLYAEWLIYIMRTRMGAIECMGSELMQNP